MQRAATTGWHQGMIQRRLGWLVCAFSSLLFPLLLSHLQEPGVQVLAKQVSNVLDGKMRDVSSEAELHRFVDNLFEEFFNLAADAGLLAYQSKRDSVDALSGTTGQRYKGCLILLQQVASNSAWQAGKLEAVAYHCSQTFAGE